KLSKESPKLFHVISSFGLIAIASLNFSIASPYFPNLFNAYPKYSVRT
ncbi:unnamed protein product, partial [marine sediment metagenome]